MLSSPKLLQYSQCKHELSCSACMLQKYLSRLFKGALVCGLFAAIFKGQSNNNPTLHKIYIIIIKVLVCIFLWLVVDVIKTMMAKLMANHFHQETYFQRMQEALRKVPTAFHCQQYVSLLTTPCHACMLLAVL